MTNLLTQFTPVCINVHNLFSDIKRNASKRPNTAIQQRFIGVLI